MRRFLTHARIDSFGSAANLVVGPFEPGLNVVFGRNEAGKSTFAAFVRGVLFGWEEARGRRNTYKPANAERAGALVFARRPGAAGAAGAGASAGAASAGAGAPGRAEGRWEVSRVRNADGLIGDAEVVKDVDRETYRTMFFLTGDELRSLRNTTEITAKLLTAGSGTNTSPARVLADVRERISGFTSRAAGADRSLVRIAAEQDGLRERIAQAEAAADRLRHEARELAELEPGCADMTARIEAASEEIEALAATRASVAECDADIARLSEQAAGLAAEAAALSEEPEAAGPLAGVSAADERGLRDRIDALEAERARRQHRVDGAKDNYDASRAAHDAFAEAESAEGRETLRARQRRAQLALSIALPVVFVAAGVALLLVQGRVHAAVSTAVLGAALIAFAVILAGAAFFLMFRPNRDSAAVEDRRAGLRWTMLQDEKRYEACRADLDSFDREIGVRLAEAGLAEAGGSLRAARRLLDDAAAGRAEAAALAQRRRAAAAELASVDASLSATREQRARLCRAAGLADDALVDAIDREIERRSRRRSELLEASEGLNRRCGELRSELSQAEHLHDFDALRLSYQQSRTRQREAERDLARLLLAERMLEASISSWESASQPEVYRQAGRLLSLMTGGRWTQVSVTDDGALAVTDGVRPALDPTRLSLSTCQQLYLALRIALLVAADNVGRSVPVLADDILASFDASRRAAAAAALAELARHRQVILLTCHEEVVEALRKADASANVVRL